MLSSFYRAGGITALASATTKAGLPTEVVDLAFDPLPEKWDRHSIVLFSLYIDDFAEGLEVAKSIRTQCPSSRIVLGGPHATLLGEDTMRIAPWLDAVALGDCLPEAMPLLKDLADGAISSLPRFITASSGGEPPNAEAFDYSIWKPGRYFPVYPVEFARGCPHNCPFCSDPVLRRGSKLGSVDSVVRVFRRIAETEPGACVRFVDSSFTSSRPFLDDLLEGLISLQLGVRWSAYAYASDIEPDLVTKLSAAGCVALFFGIESLSPAAITGKRIARDVNLVRNAVAMTRDAGIFAHCNFIIGLPRETEDSLKATLDLLPTIGADSIGGGPFYLTPGSVFERYSHKYGISIIDEQWRFKQHENFYEGTPYFRTADLTQEDMRRLSREFRYCVETATTARWNLSDYAALCWLSVGGNLESLVRLWNESPDEPDEVIDVLKEKEDVSLPQSNCVGFVQRSRTLALKESMS